jgi:hypothetical protein
VEINNVQNSFGKSQVSLLFEGKTRVRMETTDMDTAILIAVLVKEAW